MAKSIPKGEPWPAKVCDVLRQIRVNRINAKSKLADAIEYRDELKQTLRGLGPKKTEERLNTDHELVMTLDLIEYQRARSRALADQMEKVIDSADQGKFEFADECPTDFNKEALFAEAEKQRKANMVPCIGGTYWFKDKDVEFAGCVKGGGTKECRVEVDKVKRGEMKRGDMIEIEYAKYELVEIDVPKDALRVDQPKGGAASEMGGKKKDAA